MRKNSFNLSLILTTLILVVVFVPVYAQYYLYHQRDLDQSELNSAIKTLNVYSQSLGSNAEKMAREKAYNDPIVVGKLLEILSLKDYTSKRASLTMLRRLGPKAKPAISKLLEIVRKERGLLGDNALAAMSLDCLAAMKDSADSAVDELMAIAPEKKDWRLGILFTVASIRPSEQLALEFNKIRKSSHSNTEDPMIRGLALCGKYALPVVCQGIDEADWTFVYSVLRELEVSSPGMNAKLMDVLSSMEERYHNRDHPEEICKFFQKVGLYQGDIERLGKIQQENSFSRLSIAFTLAKFENGRTELEKNLESALVDVRFSSAIALEKQRVGSVPALERCALKENDPETLSVVVRVLGKLATKQTDALDALKRLIANEKTSGRAIQEIWQLSFKKSADGPYVQSLVTTVTAAEMYLRSKNLAYQVQGERGKPPSVIDSNELKIRAAELRQYLYALVGTSPVYNAPSIKPKSSIRDKWALIVAISHFGRPETFEDITFAANDAISVREYLKEAHFRDDHIKVLTDENATHEKIGTAIENWLGRNAAPEDLVVVYFSTHGRVVGKNTFLVSYDTRPGAISTTSLRMDDLVNVITNVIQCKRALVVLDACHSGAAAIQSKGIIPGYAVQLDEGVGIMLLASCKPDQLSYANKDGSQSLFTSSFLSLLRKRSSIKEAFDATKQEVQTRARLIDPTEIHLQEPVISTASWTGNDINLSVEPYAPSSPSVP